ncbi:ATP-binding protein [Bifidobacterium amazonense]|uniref:ATP-binding protein n=1 Tax=Bifidobacterium amazonense TaxID=2809027 RepID=A0ABS9VXM5_9BIFI|nr:ATP-binding protein [Bifidobacterium amazonense]MCH9276856.1 ATP-binding protein [Bifidobacterium amazonense]
MLIRFAVSNFRSINKTTELSMVAVDENTSSPFYQPNIKVNLVPEAALYGANAAGKSNILLALQWLKYAVAASLKFWDDTVPIEQFALAQKNNQSSSFELEMLVDDVHYEYYLDVNRQQIEYEAVYITKKFERICLFERQEDDVVFDNRVMRQDAIQELLTSRTLILSVIARYREPNVIKFVDSILNMRLMGESIENYQMLSLLDSVTQTRQLFDDDNMPQPTLFDEIDTVAVYRERRKRALAWLQMADLGISGVRIIKDPDRRRRKNMDVHLLHTTQGGDFPLDFSQESEGTKVWFNLIGPILDVLDSGSLMVFDELDASLHPVLSAQLLKIFRDPEINVNGAQILFSSHDTSLMKYLHSDEIWIVEKRNGATGLSSLASFDSERVRKSVDLESGYLHGHFGGIPNIDLAQLLRSKGVSI